MIDAKEARELYEQTGANVQEYLDNTIEPRVKEAIELGRTQCEVLVDAKETYRRIEPDTFDKQVITKLKALGYTVSFGFYGDTYVPRGLADDNGEGPVHRNVGFIIGW